jgi:hypothetical protein
MSLASSSLYAEVVLDCRIGVGDSVDEPFALVCVLRASGYGWLQLRQVGEPLVDLKPASRRERRAERDRVGNDGGLRSRRGGLLT